MSSLDEAIQAFKTGQKGRARKLLRELVERQPDHEGAWLWLAAAEEVEADKRRYLERALKLNPDNETTRQALARLGNGGVPLPQVADIVPPLEAVSSQTVVPWRYQGTQRGRITAIIIVSITPLFMAICQGLINPAYIERMLFSCASRGLPDCSQPVGWTMLTISIMALLANAFILLGVELALPPERVKTRLISSLICALIFIIPAMLILYVGPAVLIIMETNFGSSR